MTDEEELQELLTTIPMSGGRFLRRYFRASGEELVATKARFRSSYTVVAS